VDADLFGERRTRQTEFRTASTDDFLVHKRQRTPINGLIRPLEGSSTGC
jgi:hypothetical protein